MGKQFCCRIMCRWLAVGWLAVVSAAQQAPAQVAPGAGVAPPGQNAPNQEKFGQTPEDTAHQFLRQADVLLHRGDWQFDIGLSYTLFDREVPVLEAPSLLFPDGRVYDARLRRRLLVMPLEARYGLTDRAQLFVNVPFGWTNTELSTTGFDDFENQGGIGDTNAGVSLLLRKSKGCSYSFDPDIIATFGFTAPTGEGNLLTAVLGTPETTLGQGVWAAYWNVLFVHTYDPLIVFYGFGSRHGFERDFDGVAVLPGGQYMYRGGVGLAVNERVTLSTTLYGSYISEARLDGNRLAGTVMEPIYLRFAATIVKRCQRICEPFVEIGMTDDAANSRIGLNYTF